MKIEHEQNGSNDYSAHATQEVTLCGVGNTPEEAEENLKEKLENLKLFLE